MKLNPNSRRVGAFRAEGLLAVAFLAVIVTTPQASAALRVWTGGGTDANWSTPANWFGNGVPQSGDDVVFPDAASRLANIANLPGLPLNSIRFTGGGYSITGNPLVLSNGIVFDPPAAANTATLGVVLSFVRSQTIQVTRGDFTLGGALQFYSAAGVNQTTFSSSPGARIVAAGAVTGTNNVLVTGGGEVQFNAFGGADFRGKLRAVAGTAIVEGQNSVGNEVDLEVGPGGGVEFGRSQSGGTFRFLRVRLEENSQLLMNRVSLVTGQVTLFGNSLIDGDKNHFDSPGFHQINFGILQGLLSPNGFIVRATNGPAVIRDTEVGFGSSPAYFDVSGSPTPALGFDASIEGAIEFEKLGNGYLRLSSSNSFGGLRASIRDGTVELRHPLALGRASGGFVRRDIVLTGSGALVLRDIVLPNDNVLQVQGDAPLPGGGVGSSLFAFGTCEWPGHVQLDSGLFVFANNFTLSGPVSGAGGMECFFGTVRLSGASANTFTGPLTADCELLELGKPSGVKAFSGALIVGKPGTSTPTEARWLNAYQNVGGALTLYANGLVNLNGFNDDFGAVTFNGGRVETGNGQFAIYQPLTVNPSGSRAVIDGFLGLPPGQRVFVVADGDADCDLQISATVFGSATHLRKQGAGTMCLAAANTYTGLTLVEEGTLLAGSAGSLGTTGSSTIVSDGATLWLNFPAGTVNEQLSLRGAGSSVASGALLISGNIEVRNMFPAIFPTMELVGNTTIHVDSGHHLAITGELRGNGSLTKNGPGSLAFAGSQANTYTGETLIREGTLFLNKPTGVTAVPSHLSIGGGGGLFGAAATVRHFAGSTIIGSVTVDRGGLWDLNGFSEGFGVADLQGRPALTLKVGGDVQTGAGTLFLPVGGDVVVNPGSFPGASSSISGSLGLDPGPHRFTVQSGVPIFGLERPDLDVSAAISQTSTAADIVKEGFGEMRLGASNRFSGSVTANGGRVTAAHSFALGTTAAGTFVNSNASLALDGGIAVGFEPLTLNTTTAAALTSLGAVTNFWRGNITLQRTAGISVPELGGVLRFESFFGCCPSFITGPGGVTKSGPGAVVITGTIANNYAGPTTVNDGLLEASRNQGPALSSNVVVSGANSILRTGRTPAIKALPTAASMTVQDGALWTMNPANTETLSRLQGDGRLEVGTGGALTISNSVSCEFSGPISGSGALNKYGLATLHVTGSSPGYTGTATVFDGTYKVDGYFPISPVTVKISSILRGYGAVGDVTVENGGVVRVDPGRPGQLGGEMQMNSANFQNGGVLGLALFGPHPTAGNDRLFVLNAVTLTSPTLSSGFNYPPHEGDVITLIDKIAAGAVSGAIGGFPEGAIRLIGSIPVVTSYVGGDGNDVTLTVTNLPLQAGGSQFVSSSSGNILVPDDCSQLRLVVTNRSVAPVTNLRGTLRSLTDGVVVTIAESAFPNLAPNARGTNLSPFQIRTIPGFSCGAGAEFELVLTASNAPPIAILYTFVGAPGYSLQFDGRDDQVEVPANTFSGVVNNFTIELWANPTANRAASPETNAGISVLLSRPNQRFAVFPDRGNLAYGATHVSAGLSIGGNGISVFEHGTNRVLGAIHLPSRLVYSNAVSGWTHVALVYASRQPQLYVNGALVRSGAASIFSSVHPSGSLGGSSQGDYGNFEGQLDEVRIWNVALNQSQIQTNMTRRLAGTEPNLVTYFRADEGGGSLLTDSAPASPNPSGTLLNGTAFALANSAPITPPDADCLSRGGACESCFVVTGTFTTNTPTLTEFLSATGSPSLCFPTRACPGPLDIPDPPPTRFIQHTFTNTSSSDACVTAQLHFDCPASPLGALHVAAYVGAFDPGSACSNYLGDPGGDSTVPFSFRVPARTNVVLVVTLRVGDIGCDNYTLELFGLPCPPPTLHIAKDAAPDKVRLNWSSAYPDYRLQSVNSLDGPGTHPFNNVVSPPVLVGGKFAVTNAVSTPRQFFRLAR